MDSISSRVTKLRLDLVRPWRASGRGRASLPGCSTGQPAMAQEVHYIRQHGVDGVRRSPEEKFMHFYSQFYDRSERAGAGDVVLKNPIFSVVVGIPTATTALRTVDWKGLIL